MTTSLFAVEVFAMGLFVSYPYYTLLYIPSVNSLLETVVLWDVALYPRMALKAFYLYPVIDVLCKLQ